MNESRVNSQQIFVGVTGGRADVLRWNNRTPVEQSNKISKLKGAPRKTKARNREALIETIGQALGAITSRDAKCPLKYCGCRVLGQPL
jgi:hypothetical protein